MNTMTIIQHAAAASAAFVALVCVVDSIIINNLIIFDVDPPFVRSFTFCIPSLVVPDEISGDRNHHHPLLRHLFLVLVLVAPMMIMAVTTTTWRCYYHCIV